MSGVLTEEDINLDEDLEQNKQETIRMIRNKTREMMSQRHSTTGLGTNITQDEIAELVSLATSRTQNAPLGEKDDINNSENDLKKKNNAKQNRKLTKEEKEIALIELRERVFKKERVCPFWFLYFAWIFITLWTLACTFLAIYWVIQFNQVLDARNNSYTSQCDNENSIDMRKKNSKKN